jgi:hypothetical protein
VQFLATKYVQFLATKYQNFLYTKNKRRQIDTNIELFLYNERIRCNQNTPRISPQLVEAHAPIAQFWEYHHHIYIQAKKDLREEWVQKKYKIIEDGIQRIMQDGEPD